MQTWQIMMGCNLLSVLACLACILWFWLRKDDEFGGFDDSFEQTMSTLARKEEEPK